MCQWVYRRYILPNNNQGVSIASLGWELALGHFLMLCEKIPFTKETARSLGSMHILSSLLRKQFTIGKFRSRLSLRHKLWMLNSKKAHPHSLQSSRHRNRVQSMRDLRLYCGSRDQQDMWNAFSVTESALLDPLLPGACRISLSGLSQNNHLEWFPREFPVLCHGLVQILEVLSGSRSPYPSMSQNARTRLLRIEILLREGGTLPSSLGDTILANTKRAY
jgi:hypothetical protein